MKAGFDKDYLRPLNRVRAYQQVLFLSCLLGASGKILGRKLLREGKPDEIWSRLKFPKERLPKKDFLLLEVALRQVVPAGGIQDCMGRMLHLDYKGTWKVNVFCI